ncbi:MAG TPA: Crp/Fnr family transcriptional regulator [Chitinophagaceae bacterium]|nr:Crp/Fnr family transcriptional regulator [Chitinophagaceae bacterium]
MPNKPSADTSKKVEPLVKFISQIAPLNKEIEKYIYDHCFPKKLLRGKFLLKPGEHCQHYYFIHKGLLRAYIKYAGKEITTWINPENEITTSIRSMSNNEPSREYIQALEDSDLIVIPYTALQQLYDNYPVMNTIGRIVLEEYYGGAEDRAFISRIPNAEMRYDHFLRSSPELATRVPSKYIASYLGMTEETLSRLRRKKTMKEKKAL